ncbi:hypothetical protein [Streptomyces daqingensis]|uniref:hypothetical protein n=1 Tax=Streptomyces daqingensis TaxID=1472640 RepID=UPI00166F27CF|nr:hypothetical protein [Streptomyces daqingensis]
MRRGTQGSPGRRPVPRRRTAARGGRPFAVSYVVSCMGDGIFYVVAALYFTRIVGLDPVH